MGSQQKTVKPRLLLETKFYPPRSPRDLVPRPRLRDSLVRGTASKLILVSAPAGFGKSTLLAQWLDDWLDAEPAADATERAAAWLSLDRDDNDPASFWTYVIVALRTAVPGIGGSALGLLEAPQPALIQTVLTTLLNDLGALERDAVLVLDDYHVIESREVHEGMAFLIDHLPPRLHLVIASRADPALPLARLRARGELAETRAAELRFTPDEAAAYLNGLMGLRLTAGDVAVLEGRTEGWIAALQLAALSMQGRDDTAGFIAGFAGDDRYILDFLVEEVLQRQPARIQAFLLQTSVLGRLSGPLCDAVTGQGDGKATLEALDRGNLFLVPLDDRRRWYRYHHLFADVLHARLLDEQPGDLPELHRRASSTVTCRRRFATRWRARTSIGRRTWWSGPGRPCASFGRKRPCSAGSRHFPTRCWVAGPCSALPTPLSWPSAASSTTLRRACATPSDGWTPLPEATTDRQRHRRR